MGWMQALFGGLGALGGLFGRNKPQMHDLNLYGMNPTQRTNLADSAYGQLMGMYGMDPGAFWGGQDAWTTGGGNIGEKAMMDYLFARNAGGGNISFGGGGRAHGFVPKASLIDMSDDAFQLMLPDELRENVQGSARRLHTSLAEQQIRDMEDRRRLAGDAEYDAGAEFMNQAAFRNANMRVAEQVLGVEGAWMPAAANRRGGALGMNAQLGTSASIAGAANRTQASGINAGLGAQYAGMNAQLAALRSGSAQFLMGLRGRDEDRMLQRYGMLNQMNMGWQSPNAQMQFGPQQQNWLQALMGGAGAGFNLYGGLQGLGLFGGGSSIPGGGMGGGARGGM